MCDDPIRLKLGKVYGGLLRASRKSLGHSDESHKEKNLSSQTAYVRTPGVESRPTGKVTSEHTQITAAGGNGRCNYAVNPSTSVKVNISGSGAHLKLKTLSPDLPAGM
jgi:hypothetical protein